MGLLDDAIREHLELKRRRGADASEISRQEREALGAATRAGEVEARPALEPAAEPPPPADKPSWEKDDATRVVLPEPPSNEPPLAIPAPPASRTTEPPPAGPPAIPEPSAPKATEPPPIPEPPRSEPPTA
ncbi:MAG: hypothetical protein M3401_00745, partial [Actinomycetota bacterium]|nr:hypothetical protein [Actinomycetota bacterium]